MKKHLCSAALFLGLLAAFLFGLSLYFQPKNNTPEAGIQDYRASGFLSEAAGSLDYVVLGDSIPLTGVNPWVIWENQGFTGYVCATTGQTAEKSAAFLRTLFQTQAPKVVFLEANQLYKQYSALDAAAARVTDAVPVLRYHDNWKFLRPSQALRPVNYGQDVPEKGYYLRKQIEAADPGDYMAPAGTSDPIPTESRKSLERIAEQCRAQGSRLVLISLPSPANWNDGCHRAVEALAQELGVSYLDLNLEDLSINWSLDTLDGGDHLNETGAAKASAFLGDWLARNAELNDKRENPDYEDWRQDYAWFVSAAAAAEDTL